MQIYKPMVTAAKTGTIQLQALTRDGFPGRQIQKHILPNIQSLGYWDARGPQQWGLDWHHHRGLQFSFMESGQLSYGINDTRRPLQTGELTVSLPWQPHCLGDPYIDSGKFCWFILDITAEKADPMWRWPSWIILSPADREELTYLLKHNQSIFRRVNTDIRQCFEVITGHIANESTDTSALTLKLNELFYNLLQLLRKGASARDLYPHKTNKIVEEFLMDLRYNLILSSNQWTLSSMAQQVGLGTTRFSNICHELTNLTPIQYLNQCRIEKAARMLVDEPHRSITDIAFTCGFSSSQYFSTVFRRYFETGPQRYRNQRVKFRD